MSGRLPRVSASVLVWVAFLCLATSGPARAQSVEKGRLIYESRCGGCHSVEVNRVGPAHAGLLGRRAGSVNDYEYSSALKGSKLIWTRENLLLWLADPEALIPGQDMNYKLGDAQERLDVVAFLATLKAKSESQPERH